MANQILSKHYTNVKEKPENKETNEVNRICGNIIINIYVYVKINVSRYINNINSYAQTIQALKFIMQNFGLKNITFYDIEPSLFISSLLSLTKLQTLLPFFFPCLVFLLPHRIQIHPSNSIHHPLLTCSTLIKLPFFTFLLYSVDTSNHQCLVKHIYYIFLHN